MHCNVGTMDRLERIFNGAAFMLVTVFLVSGFWQYLSGAYGLIRFLTGLFAFCPGYLPFNYSTKSKI
jgi:hypothetical protein